MIDDMPPLGPRVCAKRKALEGQLFFCPVQGCVNKHLSAPGLNIRENISFPKWVAKVSGMLDRRVADFNIKSIYERFTKGPKMKG